MDFRRVGRGSPEDPFYETTTHAWSYLIFQNYFSILLIERMCFFSEPCVLIRFFCCYGRFKF